MSKSKTTKLRRRHAGAPPPREAIGETRGKISEIVVDLARPWLERLGPNPPSAVVALGYQLCGLVWNVTRLGDVEVREAEFARVLRDVLAKAPDGTQLEMEQFAIGVYRRALELYPEDPRHVIDVGIENHGAGRFHVTVASLRGGEGA